MLRKHFMMSGFEKPDYIITYYANLKVPFIGGEETKNLTMWETGSESEPLAEFKVVSDTYSNGYGLWGIKTSNPTAYYGLILDSYNNTYYADSYNSNSITGIIFPEGITEIGGRLLSGSSLLDVSLPNSLISIGANTFNTCLKLTNITIPNNVININENAFKNCTSLVNFNAPLLPPSLSGSDIFGDFTELLHLKINVLLPLTYEQDTDWNKYSTKLVHYHDPNSLYYRSSKALNIFSDTTKNKIYSDNVGEGIIDFILSPTRILGSNFMNYKTSLSYIWLPNTVTAIDGSAFSGCNLLETCIFPESLLSIGRLAFYSCSMLQSISIPKNVQDIYYDAFSGCGSVDTIVVDEANNVYDSRENCNAIIETSSNTLIRGCNNTIIPNSVIKIDVGAFNKCNKLTNIIIPDGVTSIGNAAFNGCSSLNSITIPISVSTINSPTTSDCPNLSTIIFLAPSIEAYCNSALNNKLYSSLYLYSPKRVLKIDNEEITNLIIPEGVTTIGNLAFYNFDSLTSVTIPSSATNIGSDIFYGCNSIGSVQWNAVNCNDFTYSSAPFSLLESITTFQFGDSVQYIPQYLCCDMRNLQHITIPDSVTNIGNGAFYNCYSLNSVVLPTNITNIGKETFYLCTSLTSIVIPNNVTSIDDKAFWRCSALASITIPSKVTSIIPSAFKECPSLSTIVVEENNLIYDSRNNCNAIIETASNTLIIGCLNTTIPNNISIIGASSFYRSTNLTSIVIPDSVTTIQHEAFYGCDNLTTVSMSNNVVTLGDDVFLGCDLLTDITIPNSVTSIGVSVFSGCSSLTEIVLSNSISRLPMDMFSNCTSLTSIIIPESVTSIGQLVFENCSSLTSVTIPNSVTSIAAGAFRNCSSLTSITIPDSVTSFAGTALIGCTNLEDPIYNKKYFIRLPYSYSGSYTIPAGPTVIGDYACYGCSELTSVIIPNGVTNIGSNSFQDCTSLTTVTIPKSVSFIAKDPFKGCSNLTKINFQGTKAEWGNISKNMNWNSTIYNFCTIYCTDGNLAAKS